MISPTIADLSRDVLDTLSVNDIIYAEVSHPGAMGNSL